MASTVVRRPLPALISLLALLLLTGIVWWRVMNRDNGDDTQAASCPTPTPTVSRTVLPGPASITVRVLNATTKNGLAAKVSTSLGGAGFRTIAPGNDKAKHASPAQIRFGPTGKRAATLVRYYFPGATLEATKGKTATVTVSLGTRFKGVASARTVAKALTRADLATASPTPTPPADAPSSGASASC